MKVLPADENRISLLSENPSNRSVFGAPAADGSAESVHAESAHVQLTTGDRSETRVDSMRKPSATESGWPCPVKILSISLSDVDQAALCKILQEVSPDPDRNCRWVVHPISSLASAAEELVGQEIPIVISETKLSPGTWQTILDQISRLTRPPLLIVASRLADERLWAEALNLGAWDVLTKPFDTEEVTRIVALAWRHWNESREALSATGRRSGRNLSDGS